MTSAQFWGGVAVAIGMVIAVVAGFLYHWYRINRDILHDERKKLTVWAERYARQLAEQMFRDYVKGIRINVPVRLVNESDINWGESSKDDTAA